MSFNSGQFIADGNAVDVEVGFVPDYVFAVEGLEETNPQLHYWFRSAINSASANGQFGLTLSGGTLTRHAGATNGFVPLDTVALRLLLPNPAGGDDLAIALPVGFVAGTARPTARTSTALGTVTKPSVNNVAAKKGLIFECTFDNDVYGTEPTWPTEAGKSVTDDNSNIWIAREEKSENRGIKGFTLGDTGQTDSDEWAWFAYSIDKVSPDRDMANFDSA